jgi:hypothetical protein
LSPIFAYITIKEEREDKQQEEVVVVSTQDLVGQEVCSKKPDHSYFTSAMLTIVVTT